MADVIKRDVKAEAEGISVLLDVLWENITEESKEKPSVEKCFKSLESRNGHIIELTS